MATPLEGSATMDTSAIDRFAQPGSFCHPGFGMIVLQPLPALLQALSSQPRELPVLRVRVVPPTAGTCGDAAGKTGWYPRSPDAATMATPGWLKKCSQPASLSLSSTPQLFAMA